MILDRYLLKEIVKVWLVILTILILIAMSNKLVRLIGKAATGELSPALLMQLIGLQLPDLFAFMLPLALFLSILLVISRCSVEQELVAMFSIGVPWRRFVTLCLGLSTVSVIITSFFTLVVVPYACHLKDQLIKQEESVALIQTLSPGRFYSFQGDRLVFYVEDFTDKKELKEVFIAEQPKAHPDEKDPWTVVSAKHGKIVAHHSGHVYVELVKGHRYDGTPGFQDYMAIDFQSYGKLIEKKRPQEGLYYYSAMPTRMLLQDKNPNFVSEFQWRISQALTAPILALMALPLGRVGVRKGRFQRLLPAILLFILYYALLNLCRRWIAQGVIPGIIGMWWVHALALGVALWMLLSATGTLHQWFYHLKRPHVQKA